MNRTLSSKEEQLLMRLQSAAERIPVPDSVSPERIGRFLDARVSRKKPIWLRPAGRIMAAAACLAVMIGVAALYMNGGLAPKSGSVMDGGAPAGGGTETAPAMDAPSEAAGESADSADSAGPAAEMAPEMNGQAAPSWRSGEYTVTAEDGRLSLYADGDGLLMETAYAADGDAMTFALAGIGEHAAVLYAEPGQVMTLRVYAAGEEGLEMLGETEVGGSYLGCRTEDGVLLIELADGGGLAYTVRFQMENGRLTERTEPPEGSGGKEGGA